ncbi:MAG: protein kinase [Gemmatimonadetes bacterium]|nr:protein kinase [Gemmatimonadota bacterium]
MTDPIMLTDNAHTGWPEELSEEYEYLGELGRGGMAVVYRARERALGREVAVKVVRPRFHADEEAVSRLAREARTVAQLEHPNIVSLHAIKKLNNGLALVMQIVPGMTLKAALAAGPMAGERAEAILKDIARALAYAHRCGVVHRDVKPENIFLDDVTGRALLSDFGVARSITENTELTATGTAIGTPTYMSPEQIDGGALDGRSDLYALGMVGWEMLSGQRPWMGESLYSVIYRQKHDQPTPLDVLRPDVPPRLQFLIEGLLPKRAEHRWPSAARFLTLLSATDKLPGFKEWQAAAKKRRKAGAKAGRNVQVASVSPQSSTVQFRRGETPAGLTPSSLNRASVTASGEVVRPASPWGQPAIPGPFDQPGGRSLARPIAFAVIAIAAVASAAWYATRPPAATAARPDSLTLADAGTVEVPVIPASPDTGTAMSDTAAGAIDTASLGQLPAGTVDSAAEPTRPPRRDSVPVTASPGPSPTPAPTPPAVTPESARAPAPDAPSVTFPADRWTIAAGTRHSCMLSGEGRALCWGNNESGQLGDGTFDARVAPTPVTGDFTFTQVASGQSHSCGISRDGDALCWGANASGQLGDGTTTPRSAPVPVNGRTNFRAVRAGRTHTCGLTTSGNVRCWGGNSRGQLGDGSRAPKVTPVAVTLGGSAGALSAGQSHTCALLRTGEAMCWGQNDAGQLGDGTTTDHATPIPVNTSARFVSIAAGRAHTCAVTVDGDLYCWGQNNYGQLGAPGAASAIPQKVESGASYAVVSSGSDHSCARTRDGRGLCWGRNAQGQLGDGSTTDRDRPTAIRGAGSFSVLSAYGAHTCGVANGEAFCWGYNVDGQLGVGDRENAALPQRVAGPGR